MKLSARNQLKGKVESIEEGAVNSKVKIKLTDPATMTSVITKEAIESLGIKPGDEVIVVVKSSDVMIGKE